MKVNKHGIYYNKVSESIVCKECECNISIVLDDILYYNKPKKVRFYRDLYDGIYSYITKYKYYCRCPECHEEILISDEVYNKLVRRKNCSNYKSDSTKIDEYLDYFYKEIHNKNSSLFNHGVAYKEACLYLRGDKK